MSSAAMIRLNIEDVISFGKVAAALGIEIPDDLIRSVELEGAKQKKLGADELEFAWIDLARAWLRPRRKGRAIDVPGNIA